jgi:hypothetical protein
VSADHTSATVDRSSPTAKAAPIEQLSATLIWTIMRVLEMETAIDISAATIAEALIVAARRNVGREMTDLGRVGIRGHYGHAK